MTAQSRDMQSKFMSASVQLWRRASNGLSNSLCRVTGTVQPCTIPKPMEGTGLLELSHLKKSGEAVIHQSKLGGVEAMADTELQIEKQRVSDQRMRVLKQQAVVLSLNREGGERLQEAAEHLNSLRDELRSMESRLEQLIINS